MCHKRPIPVSGGTPGGRGAALGRTSSELSYVEEVPPSCEKKVRDKPPNSQAYCAIFLDLAEQYFRSAALLTAQEPLKNEYEERLRRGASCQLRLALLRKFVVHRENLCIMRVLHHYERLADHQRGLTKQEKRIVGDLRREHSQSIREHQLAMIRMDVERYDAQLLFDLILNGNVLHADYSKWERSHQLIRGVLLVEVEAMVEKSERVLARVYALVRGDKEPIKDLLEKHPLSH